MYVEVIVSQRCVCKVTIGPHTEFIQAQTMWKWRQRNVAPIHRHQICFIKMQLHRLRLDKVLHTICFKILGSIFHSWMPLNLTHLCHIIYWHYVYAIFKTSTIHMNMIIRHKLEMWANAQRDGRPSGCRWRPVFNAANFGSRPLLECRAVTLPRRETRWNLLGCPKLANRSQPLLWGHVEQILLFNKFLSDCRYMP